MLCCYMLGCQSTPVIQPEPITPKITLPEVQEPESKVKVIPYPPSDIVRESQPLPPIQQPTRVILPVEPKSPPTRQLKDGQGIPAYTNAFNRYTEALRQNNLAEAEKNLLQAQRIAPQSADVYRELARLANLRKQGGTAEAFSRKGLSFAQNNVQRKQLWEQILQSAKIRQSAVLIQQAQQQIAKF